MELRSEDTRGNQVQIFHMVGGLGETSYANNSKLQEKAIAQAKAVLEESISDLYTKLQPKILMVADLGCSSGPTTFMVMSEILHAVSAICNRLGDQPAPDVLYFLNDLPGNDFNTLFQSLPCNAQIEGDEMKNVLPYHVAAVPGSFYGRLFPKKSIHFIHSSYSLHWLSQVPEGLKDNKGFPVNPGNIFVAKTSPLGVFKSYAEQFRKDFSKFLNLRSEEIVSEGKMILTFQGRSHLHPQNGEIYLLWGLLADALNNMVLEGLLENSKVDTFDLPFYPPSMEEVREVVLLEGSFELYMARTFEFDWDPYDDDDNSEDSIQDTFSSGKNVAKTIRAVLEPMLAKHFGEEIIDPLFSRFARNVSSHLLKQKTKCMNFIIVLRRFIKDH